MKKILAALAAVLLLFAACAAGAEGEFVYDTWDGNNSLKEYTGEGGDIVIPETVDGHTVTRVTGNIFSKVRDAVTGITFPENNGAAIERHGVIHRNPSVISVLSAIPVRCKHTMFLIL